MEDWGGGGPSGGFSFSGSKTCRQRLYLSCNLWFILIEIYFPVQWCVFDWIFYPWEYVKCFYIIDYIYARIDLTPWYIVCLYCLLVVEEVLYQFKMKIGKLNGDLLQPSEIRYEVWSFSVRHLLSIAYWKILISGVKMFVVVPQAIGISLRNRIGDSAGEFLVVVLWGLFSRHSMYLNCSFSLVSVSGLGACIPSRVWLVWSLSQPAYLPWFYAPFLPVCEFLTCICVYTWFPLRFLCIHLGLLRTVAYALDFSFLWKIIGFWVNSVSC